MLIVWKPLVAIKTCAHVAKAEDSPIQTRIQLLTASGDPETALPDMTKFPSSHEATRSWLTVSE
jgi:hypothetical protein